MWSRWPNSIFMGKTLKNFKWLSTKDKVVKRALSRPCWTTILFFFVLLVFPRWRSESKNLIIADFYSIGDHLFNLDENLSRGKSRTSKTRTTRRFRLGPSVTSTVLFTPRVVISRNLLLFRFLSATYKPVELLPTCTTAPTVVVVSICSEWIGRLR